MGPTLNTINKTPQIISLYQSGSTIAKVASDLSINIKTIRKVLAQNLIPIRGCKSNLLGRRYGKLMVISLNSVIKKKQVWNCRCDCGKVAKVRTSDLTSRKQVSCGCGRDDASRENIKRAHFLNKRPNFRGYEDLHGKYLSSVKHNALKRGLEYSVTPEFLWNLFLSQDKKCILSGESIHFGKPQTASLDRVNSDMGYTVNNVQWVHKDVNLMKMVLTQNRFLQLSSKIHKNSRSGILNGTRAYLAGNLECSSDVSSWRTNIKKELSKIGIVALDPTDVVFNNQPLETPETRKKLIELRLRGEYEEIRKYMVPVVQKDLRQIDLSDFVIFNFEVEKPTFGTTHELVIATQQKKPVFVCVGDKTKTPLWFLGIIKPSYIYNSIDEIIKTLNEINDGSILISSDRWRLLRKELR